MDDALRTKNQYLLDLEEAKRRSLGRTAIEKLASKIAVLEVQLAHRWSVESRPDDAAISLMSAASCLVDGKRFSEASRLLARAQSEATRPQIVLEAGKLKDLLTAHSNPAEIFFTTSASILDNKRLRVPQKEAYIAVKRHFTRSNEHAIVQLPVGCGKTGTMAILPFGVSKGRSLVITPNLEIMRTVSKNLDHATDGSFYRKTGVFSNGIGPAAAVLDADANIRDCDSSDFVVTNIQQLLAGGSSKWLERLSSDYFDLILVDEGHHNAAPSWQHVFEHFPRAKVTSFTATPLRADGKEVQGKRVYRFPIADAIRQGYIRDIATRKLEPKELVFTLNGSTHKHTLSEVLALREEDWFSKGVALSEECNKTIVDASINAMRELRNEGTIKHQIIAAACSIDHANGIRALYAARNYNAAVLHSKMDPDKQESVRKELERGDLDVIVQVSMLGEGADYPKLGVAAIFRPFRHMVPYVQFIGRIMRVVHQDAPGDPDNRGYVVAHAGLNVDRWWGELKKLDDDDQEFFQALAFAEKDFTISSQDQNERRRFKPPMEVLTEVVDRFVEVGFLDEDRAALVEDVLHALRVRGVDPDTLGLNRAELEERILGPSIRTGEHLSATVTPQRRRQEARIRLTDRVRSAAKELLNELQIKVGGFELVKRYPKTGATNNLTAAIILLNQRVKVYAGVNSGERSELTSEELERAIRAMDELVDAVAIEVRTSRHSSPE